LSAAPYPRLGRTEGTRSILVVNDVVGLDPTQTVRNRGPRGPRTN